MARGSYRTIVPVPSLAISLLRETLSRRRHFVRVQTAEINAAKRLLRAAGVGQLGRSLRTAAGGEKLLAAVSTDPDLLTFLTHHRAVWRSAGEQVGASSSSRYVGGLGSWRGSLSRQMRRAERRPRSSPAPSPVPA